MGQSRLYIDLVALFGRFGVGGGILTAEDAGATLVLADVKLELAVLAEQSRVAVVDGAV